MTEKNKTAQKLNWFHSANKNDNYNRVGSKKENKKKKSPKDSTEG